MDLQGAVRVLKSGLGAMPWMCALMPDGSAFAIEAHRRIVRYRDGRREVVFPR